MTNKLSDVVYTATFRLNHLTTFMLLQRAACNHWGLVPFEFDLFWVNARGRSTSLYQKQNTRVLDWYS